MSVLIDLAQQFGLPLAGVGALVAAFYGRRALGVAGRLSAWATTGLLVLVVIGVGSLLGWWEVHVGTIQSHLEVLKGVLVDVGRLLADSLGVDV
jgi:hypothetical protein